MIAEIPINPVEFFSFLGCTLFGLGAYALLTRIQVDRRKLAGDTMAQIKPSPLIVKPADRFVLKEECERTMECLTLRVALMEARFTEIQEVMKKDSNSLSKEGEERSRRLHERIEAVSQSLGHDIQSLPERVIGILRTTGAIGKS